MINKTRLVNLTAASCLPDLGPVKDIICLTCERVAVETGDSVVTV